MNKRFYIGLSLMFALFCSACTKEETEDCFSGLKLNFNFALHTYEPGNMFGANVQVVRVYCFDEQGVLRHIQQETGTVLTNDYMMTVNLDPGKYTIVSWAGGFDDFFHSYHEGQMIDPATHTYTKGVQIGKTMLSDFLIFMNNTPVASTPESGSVIPQTNEMDDLYYGAVGVRDSQTSIYNFEQIEVKTGTLTERCIELIRNTNILKITVSGVEHLGLAQQGDLQLWAVACNGEYLFNNEIGAPAPMIRYTPHRKVKDQSTIVADIKTLRLHKDRHKTDPVLLYIEAPDGRRYPNKPIDVVRALLQARDPKTGAYVYGSQSDFDKIYEHPIEVRIASDLSVKIFIGEWEIINVTPA